MGYVETTLEKKWLKYSYLLVLCISISINIISSSSANQLKNLSGCMWRPGSSFAHACPVCSSWVS